MKVLGIEVDMSFYDGQVTIDEKTKVAIALCSLIAQPSTETFTGQRGHRLTKIMPPNGKQ